MGDKRFPSPSLVLPSQREGEDKNSTLPHLNPSSQKEGEEIKG